MLIQNNKKNNRKQSNQDEYKTKISKPLDFLIIKYNKITSKFQDSGTRSKESAILEFLPY